MKNEELRCAPHASWVNEYIRLRCHPERSEGSPAIMLFEGNASLRSA